MNLGIAILSSTCAITLFAGCQDPVEKERNRVRENLTKKGVDLLKPSAIEVINLKPSSVNRTTVAIDATKIKVAKPIKQKVFPEENGLSGCYLEYDSFAVQLLLYERPKELYSNLPEKWGKDDLEKLKTITKASGRTLDDAKTIEEVKEVEALLLARLSVAPGNAVIRADRVSSPSFEGILTGDFAESTRMEGLFWPVRQDDKVIRCLFRRKEGGSRGDVLEFLRHIEIE